VKCDLYEINKDNRANATHEPKRCWTKVMLDQRGPRHGPGPVLTLISIHIVGISVKLGSNVHWSGS